MARIPFLERRPAFVTGASGFIGGKLAERLLADGRPVRVLSRRPLPHLEALGAEVILGDLDNVNAVRIGCAGVSTVFHVAGRVGVWGPSSDFYRVNVDGTRNVITACQQTQVPRLVYTSSPSVVYNGHDLAGVDESAPLCTLAPCAYPTSKAFAEREVLRASSELFRTVALRPHLVWGPGDKNVVPRVLAMAKLGRLKIIGTGKNRVDVTHIRNVVDAHLLAEAAMINSMCDLPNVEVYRRPNPAGKAYFITNDEPVSLWDWINELVRGVGLPEITKRLPLPMATLMAGAMEKAWTTFPLKGEPPMTRFVVKELATDHWFKIDAAKRDLNYRPTVSVAEGTAELIEHYRRGNVF
jgi:nucleoside-diphosphate-sugar epimerase